MRARLRHLCPVLPSKKVTAHLFCIFPPGQVAKSSPDTSKWQEQLRKRRRSKHTSYNNNVWYLLVAYRVPGIVLLIPRDRGDSGCPVLQVRSRKHREANLFPSVTQPSRGGAGLRPRLAPEPALNRPLRGPCHSPSVARREFQWHLQRSGLWNVNMLIA